MKEKYSKISPVEKILILQIFRGVALTETFK